MNKVLACPSLLRVLLFVIVTVFTAAAFAALSHSSAAQVVVRISELNCDTNPETLTVSNQGSTEVSMTGWNLQSDPPTQESLPLAQFGVLDPGESLMVQAGPAASGPFVWSPQLLFRDGDPTDFAQLASDDGLTILAKVNCPASQATTAATPAATAAPAQTAATAPSSTVAAAVAAPVGGGPPGAAAGSLAPLLMMLFGSGLISAGLATLAVPFVGRRSPSVGLDLDAPEARTEMPERTAPGVKSSETESLWPVVSRNAVVNKSSRGQGSIGMFLAVLVVILAIVGLLAHLLQAGEGEPE